MEADKNPPDSQSYRFLLLYALAAAGGAVAYVPFLTILFPMRVEGMAGPSDVQWLAYATFAGAIAASLGNILFGWLSDITFRRRAWIFLGLVTSSILLISFSYIQNFEVLIGLILLWQLALNMMLAPLGAWAGDNVPDRQKGMLGGLLAFSPAFGALSAAIVTIPGLADADTRLWVVVGMVAICVLPVLLFGSPSKFAELQPVKQGDENDESAESKSRHAATRMWLARLLVQISEAALFAYLYYWFRSLDVGMGDAEVARIMSIVLVAAIPVALFAGHWADRNDRPIFPLTICAGLSAVGLVVMALSSSLIFAIAGYVIFKLAANVFLSLHTSQTLRVLPKAARRGRDLGLFNLTNTTPSMVMPWIVLGLVPVFGFKVLMVVLAIFALLACLLLFTFPAID